MDERGESRKAYDLTLSYLEILLFFKKEEDRHFIQSVTKRRFTTFFIIFFIHAMRIFEKIH